MNTIHATFTNGQIVLDSPANWPEGCRLRIAPETNEDTPETPEQIAAWLEWYRNLEPLEITPEEEAEWAAWRRQKKEYGRSKSQERIEGLFP